MNISFIIIDKSYLYNKLFSNDALVHYYLSYFIHINTVFYYGDCIIKGFLNKFCLLFPTIINV